MILGLLHLVVAGTQSQSCLCGAVATLPRLRAFAHTVIAHTHTGWSLMLAVGAIATLVALVGTSSMAQSVCGPSAWACNESNTGKLTTVRSV